MNNKDADQPAHSRSLISAFAVHFLDGIIHVLAEFKLSRLASLSVAEQAGGPNPQDRFSCDVDHSVIPDSPMTQNGEQVFEPQWRVSWEEPVI